MILFIAGLVIGASAGVVLMGCLVSGKMADLERRR